MKKQSLLASFAVTLIASANAAPVPRVNEPSVPRTAEEILALPRPATVRTKMPAENFRV